MNPVLTPARSQCQNNLTTASAHQGAKTYNNINGQTDTSVSWPKRKEKNNNNQVPKYPERTHGRGPLTVIDIRSGMGPCRRAPDVTRDYTHLKQLRGPVVFLVLYFLGELFKSAEFLRWLSDIIWEKQIFMFYMPPFMYQENRCGGGGVVKIAAKILVVIIWNNLER